MVDLLTRDRRSPVGLPLLWPFLDVRLSSPVAVFPSVSHGHGRPGSSAFFEDLLTWRNLESLGLELVVLLPLAGIVIWWRSKNP
jgi:hypothetical protein